jgi:uncharacterized SAM-binding protein YcdF (DUF218 family)
VFRLMMTVLSTSGAMIGLLAASIWLWRRPRSIAARRTMIAVAAAYALSGVYVLPYAASRLLTVGYHRFATTDLPRDGGGPVVVVVLGSGDELVGGWTDRLVITTPLEGARVLEAARVFRLVSPAWVVTSGGSHPFDRAPASSITMRDELERLGVPSGRIVTESTPLTTREEAVRIAPLVEALGVRDLVLVTSDIHMRRSLGAFRAAGRNPVPAIAPEPRRPVRPIDWLLPTPLGLELTSHVVHEVGGLMYYWLRGWWR